MTQLTREAAKALPGIEWLLEQPWGMVGIQEVKGMCFIHCQIWEWNKQHRKDCAEHWATVLDAIRAKGYKKIYARRPADDLKMAKFHRIFGFIQDAYSHATYGILAEQEI